MSNWTWADFVTWSVCFAFAAVVTQFRLRHHLKEGKGFRPMEPLTKMRLKLIDWAIGRFLFKAGRNLFVVLAITGLLSWAWYSIFPPGSV